MSHPPLSENHLAAVFGLGKSKHGMPEMLVGDFTGLDVHGVGAGEIELAFNNFEFFEETPLLKANNVSVEITTVTPPMLNSNGSDNSWHWFCQ